MRAKFAFILCVIALLVQACTIATRREPPPAVDTSTPMLDAAKAELEKGSVAIAQQKLIEIITTEPQSEATDDAQLLLGKISLQQQKYETALDYFLKVVQGPQSDLTIEAQYLAGVCLYSLERTDEAFGMIAPLAEKEHSSQQMLVQILVLLKKIYAHQSDLPSTLTVLNRLISLSLEPDQAALYQREAQTIISSQLPWDMLTTLADNRNLSNLRGYAVHALARYYADAREFEKASDNFNLVLELLPGSEFADEANLFLQKAEARKIDEPKTIGGVLPLSGRHAKLANKILQGIQLALGIYDEPKSPYRLAVMDSEDNPDLAKKAVERLILEDHVIAVIGSLLSRTADAVSSTAHSFGVPSIALSQKPNVTTIGSSVFRHALTSDMQVSHLVETAMNKYGMKKFAILFPNEPFGVEYANLFWDHVLARGGEIVGAQPYLPGETDFNGPVRRLVGTFYLEDRLEEYKFHLKEWQKNHLGGGRENQPDDILPPIQEFDGLFIPDGTKALAQIAPMLKFNDIDDVMLLGTSLWNSPSLTQRLPNELAQNTLFVDSASLSSEELGKTLFAQRFVRVFNEEPGQFEVRGYDTAMLLRTLLDRGVKTRPELIDHLARISNYSGLSGQLNMSPHREVLLPVTALTVRNRAITKADATEK